MDEGTVMLELIFTTIYCFIGLALISMGISLMQEQVTSKVEWFAGVIHLKIYFLSAIEILKISFLYYLGEVGMKETESDRIERYIVTKYPDAKITPVGRSGFQVGFGATKLERVLDQIIVDDDDSDSENETSDQEETDEESDDNDFSDSEN